MVPDHRAIETSPLESEQRMKRRTVRLLLLAGVNYSRGPTFSGGLSFGPCRPEPFVYSIVFRSLFFPSDSARYFYADH